jgi:1-phosphofructokinase family hexose kinase
MIVTVTPNGSVDTVYRRVGVPTDEEQDVEEVARTAGGKGHNVARFLAGSGEPATACGFAGGWAGREMGSLLASAGVEPRLTHIGAETRRYTTLLGRGEPRRSLHLRGPRVSPAECDALVADVASAASGATLVVIAGSLPVGASPELCARLVRAVAPVPVVLDTSGEPLVAGAAAHPAIVKVNAAEASVLGAAGPPTPDGATWGRLLERLAASASIGEWWITLGAAGAIGLVRGEPVAAVAPRVDALNTTGAGDAFLAGLILARGRGASVREAAAHATAVAAAVCEQEAPLPPDAARVRALERQVVVR